MCTIPIGPSQETRGARSSRSQDPVILPSPHVQVSTGYQYSSAGTRALCHTAADKQQLTFSKGCRDGSRFRCTCSRSPLQSRVYDSSTRLIVLTFISPPLCNYLGLCRVGSPWVMAILRWPLYKHANVHICNSSSSHKTISRRCRVPF